jgi:hypothetical protein
LKFAPEEIQDLAFMEVGTPRVSIRRGLWTLAALPKVLVWDRQAGLHAREGRPTDAFAAFCGQLSVDLALLRAGQSAGQPPTTTKARKARLYAGLF